MRTFRSCSFLDLEKDSRLIVLQSLPLGQQPQLVVRQIIACRVGLIILRTPCSGIKASKVLVRLLLLANVMLVECGLIAVYQVQQFRIVRVRRKGDWGELGISRCTGGINARIG